MSQRPFIGSLYRPLRAMSSMRAGTFLIQRPPVIKQTAVKVAFLTNAPAIAASPAGFPLDPSLTVTVFGILDVLAGMQQCLTVKAPIDISAVRCIAAIVDDPQ